MSNALSLPTLAGVRPATATSIMEPSNPPAARAVEDIDSVTLRAVAAGDRDAFRGLVERWQGRIINFFYRSTGNRSDAEDLAQETFVELFRAAPRYKAQGSFSAFLFTLARRRLIDRYRYSARRPLSYVDPEDFQRVQDGRRDGLTYELEEAFHQTLAKLPDNHRDAILMLQQQGLSYEEIASAMDASLSTVKTWIHRARKVLREELKDFA